MGMSYFLFLILPLAMVFQLSVLPHLPWGLFEVNIVLIVLFLILRYKPWLGAALACAIGLFFEAYSSRLFFTAFFSFIGPLSAAWACFYFFPSLRKPRDLRDYFFFTIFYEGVIILSVAPLYFYGDIRIKHILQDMAWSALILAISLLIFFAYDAHSKSIFHSRRRA